VIEFALAAREQFIEALADERRGREL